MAKKYSSTGVITEIQMPAETNLYEKKKRGILICATGHDYYGMMALRLAISIHVHDPKMPITLVTEGEAYNWAVKKYSWFFDQVLMAPKEYLYVGEVRTDIKVKTYADIISPYDETILIDADTLWLGKKKPKELFERFAKDDLFFPCWRAMDITDPTLDRECFAYFALPSEIRETYKFKKGTYYDLSAEFIYFKKTAAVKKFFASAREEFDSPKVKTREFAGAAFNEQVSFSISLLMNKLSIREPLFKPTYWSGWQDQKKRYNFAELSELFYILSVGGAKTLDYIRSEYDYLAKAYLGRVQITDIPATVEDKITYLPKRRND